MSKTNKIGSSAVREYVVRKYIREAKRAALRRFSVNAGEVHRALGLQNRVPQVCNALQSGKFLHENDLRIVEKTGPPSGLSTSVTITYEFSPTVPLHNERPSPSPFLALRGIARDVFSALGGGEDFIRSEREAWSLPKEGSRS